MPIIQEKFQISAPRQRNDDTPDAWADVKSTHRQYPQNHLPLPSMAIDAPVMKENGGMPLVLAGSTDVTDNVNPADLKRGFDIHPMLMTDDQYMGDHQDHFYGDAGGFVERNNYLDRA